MEEPMSTILGVFVWQLDTSKVLGVQDQQSGSALGLYPRNGSGATIVWEVDVTKNAIFLDSGEGQLAVDFKNGSISAEVPLVLSTYTGTPTNSQKWSVLARQGFITSVANPSLVVDDKGRGTAPGNPVWAYPINGSPAQQWKLTPLTTFLAQPDAKPLVTA